MRISNKQFKNKKGYFFIIDALIGSTIIFFALMIILNSNASPPQTQYKYELAEEYTQFLMNTRMQDINNPLIVDMTAAGIVNSKYTVMEQIDWWYYSHNIGNATLVLQNLTTALMPEKYGFSYTIIDGSTSTAIYTHSIDTLSDAKAIIVSKKITFLPLNDTAMFGPVIVEVKVWI